MRASGQNFYFISPMSKGGVGRNRVKGKAGRALQQGSGEDTQMIVMELILRLRFNYNQQVNSASRNNASESLSVPNGLANN